MNVETLDKAELLMLLSILEGELEAQDVVIHTLRVRHSHQRTENNESFFPKSYAFVVELRVRLCGWCV